MTALAQSGDQAARENWSRYLYGKTRGHLEYMAQAKKCEGMYVGGGEQWSNEDKAILERQRRPFYEFNEVMPSINSALGYQIHNRMDIAFKPRGGAGDLVKATTISKVVMQVCDQAKMRWKETQVFGDGLIQQRGYWDLRMDFGKNIRGEIALGTLDPLDVVPDPDAKSYDPDDWADVIVTRWLTLDQIEELYGRVARDKVENDKGDTGDFGDMDDETRRNKFGGVLGMGSYDGYLSLDDNTRRYRIIDRQKHVFENTACIVSPEGDVQAEALLSPEQIADALTKGAMKAKRMKRRIKWVVSTWCHTLFDEYSPYEHFSIIPYFAYFRRGKTRGMVDNAIGPQEALNKAVSQNVHIVNSAANSGWIVEENSLTNMDTDELEEVGAMTGLVLEHKHGSTEPKKITPNPVPQGIDRLIDRATKALKDVTVPDAMRGNEGTAISGIAKQADQFASQQQLAVPLDNLAYTRQLLATRMLKLVQRYFDSHRIYRITETDPATGKEVENVLEINKFDPMTGDYLNDITIGEYDVVITEQPMQVTFENSQFQQALEMRKEGVRIPDAIVVRYSNLSDKEKILEQMASADQPADPLMEAKAKLLEAQARKTDADATKTGVTSQFSAVQTAEVIAAVPSTAGLADALLRSAGYVDHDASPIVPQATGDASGLAINPIKSHQTGMQFTPGDNTHPNLPAQPQSAAVGAMQGIETPAADSVGVH